MHFRKSILASHEDGLHGDKLGITYSGAIMRRLGNDIDCWNEDVRICANAVKEEPVAPSSMKSPWWLEP